MYVQLQCPLICTVQDADGDVVRCRWSSSSQGECAGVCNAFSYGTLDGVSLGLIFSTLILISTLLTSTGQA